MVSGSPASEDDTGESTGASYPSTRASAPEAVECAEIVMREQAGGILSAIWRAGGALLDETGCNYRSRHKLCCALILTASNRHLLETPMRKLVRKLGVLF